MLLGLLVVPSVGVVPETVAISAVATHVARQALLLRCSPTRHDQIDLAVFGHFGFGIEASHGELHVCGEAGLAAEDAEAAADAGLLLLLVEDLPSLQVGHGKRCFY